MRYQESGRQRRNNFKIIVRVLLLVEDVMGWLDMRGPMLLILDKGDGVILTLAKRETCLPNTGGRLWTAYGSVVVVQCSAV